MAQNGITGAAADQIVQSITSFALYGFPESHAASFALLVYASAYLKAHYPAAFYTALLNNQPMGFYSPATLVKDAQRHGVRFASIDVQVSKWNCLVQDDGAIRLGLRYVRGLRDEAGQRIERAEGTGQRAERRFTSFDDARRARRATPGRAAHAGGNRRARARSAAIADRRCGRPKRAGRPAGPLLMDTDDGHGQLFTSRLADFPTCRRPIDLRRPCRRCRSPTVSRRLRRHGPHDRPASDGVPARVACDARRAARARSGATRAPAGACASPARCSSASGRARPRDLSFSRSRTKPASPTSSSRPTCSARYKRVIVDEPYLLVEGVLQNQDGAVSVKADRVDALRYSGPEVESHDFY